MSVEIRKFFDHRRVINDANNAVIDKLCIQVVNEAKKMSPFNLGQLRNSIMAKTPRMEYGLYDGNSIISNPRKNEGIVGINLNYAYYQEFGTKHMKPHPYLRPAITLKVYNLPESTVKMMYNSEVALGANKGGERVKFF